jgi:hypothetical protein
MDELIGRLAEKVGIGNAVAEKPIGLILDFLRKEGPSDIIQALIDKKPGRRSRDCRLRKQRQSRKFDRRGLMALGTRLMPLGLSMAEIQNTARELFRFGRDTTGAGQMGEIIAGKPGLGQFA